MECLHQDFAQFGIPETLVTDNGTCFTNDDLEAFLKANGMHHLTSAPYHPASNGLAEHAVQIVKRGLKKVAQGTLNTQLAKVLFAYRLTPQGMTGVWPAEFFLGQRPRSKLNLLRPNTAEHVEGRQLQQKLNYDVLTQLTHLKRERMCILETLVDEKCGCQAALLSTHALCLFWFEDDMSVPLGAIKIICGLDRVQSYRSQTHHFLSCQWYIPEWWGYPGSNSSSAVSVGERIG